jgi:ABC-type bacteriocin/lantibiotic exporter with double-glycine peptidase domain
VNWSAKGIITGSGGLYFFSPTILQVPAFSQDDPQWQDIELGPSQDTIGTAGCALCSAAMVMRFYGLDTDPARLNEYLSFHQGYTPEGWIYWEKAAALSSGHVAKVYEDAPSYQLIDENLLLSNPVIVRLHLSSGTTHFVVVVGKSGWDYLIRDPAAMEMGVYKLALRSNEVTGLRYYANH